MAMATPKSDGDVGGRAVKVRIGGGVLDHDSKRCGALVAQQEGDGDGLVRLKGYATSRAVEVGADDHAGRSTCFPSEVSSGRTVIPSAPSISCLPPSVRVTLKIRFVTASGKPLAVIGPAAGTAGSGAFVRTVSTGMISS